VIAQSVAKFATADGGFTGELDDAASTGVPALSTTLAVSAPEIDHRYSSAAENDGLPTPPLNVYEGADAPRTTYPNDAEKFGLVVREATDVHPDGSVWVVAVRSVIHSAHTTSSWTVPVGSTPVTVVPATPVWGVETARSARANGVSYLSFRDLRLGLSGPGRLSVRV
jgi:hypothetical protein